MSFGLILLALLGSLSESRRTADDLTGIKCVVSGEAAARNYSCTYKQGTVYFNCHASRHKFENRREEFETRANHQLVVTGQYAQRQCPIRNVPIFHGSTGGLAWPASSSGFVASIVGSN